MCVIWIGLEIEFWGKKSNILKCLFLGRFNKKLVYIVFWVFLGEFMV